MKEMYVPGLTRPEQNSYPSRYGDIFMPEGRSDQKPPTRQANPVISERYAEVKKMYEEESKSWPVDLKRHVEKIMEEEIRNASKGGSRPPKKPNSSLSKEEVGRQYSVRGEVMEELRGLSTGSTLEQPKVIMPKKIIPFIGKDAEAIVQGKRREANMPKGTEAYNLNTVNLAGVTDPGLRQIGERINMRLARNLMDYREVERSIQDLEGVLKGLTPGSPNEAWGRNLYNELYNEVVRQRQLAGEVNWEEVKQNLLNATRAGDLKRIEDIVKKYYDFNEQRINVHDLVEVSLSDDAIAGNTYGYALEYVLESIINVADLTPLGHIPNPTFTQSENISRLIKTTLDLDQDQHKEFYKYLKELQERRQLSHELYKSLSTKGAYEKYVGENLKNDGFNYLENEIAGVSETQGLWEKVMARRVGNSKRILTQQEFDGVHEEVRQLLETNAKMRDGTSTKLKKKFHVHKPGQRDPIEIVRSLRQWEIDRAAVVGRSIAHVSGRAISYGTIGDLPSIGDELYTSVNAEYVARITASMQVSAKRFLEGGFTASAQYIKDWVKNMKIIAKEKGLTYGEEGEKKGLYGQDVSSWIYLDTSVPDLKTHGWRNRRTLLKNKKYARIEASGLTIGSYLDKKWEDLKKTLKGNALYGELNRIRGSAQPLTADELYYLDNKEATRIGKEDRIKHIIYSRRIEKDVLKQRLYLGSLLRESNFTPMLKEEIWKKVSEFLPSRIAAFFPKERADILKLNGAKMGDTEWKTLSDKLFMAEMDRVRKQAERVKDNIFTEAKLSDFYRDNGITSRSDIDYLAKITRLGKEKSKLLSRMIFPQNAFLDDAPEPEWNNLGKEDVGRLLVNDYAGYSTANNERNAIIANPAMRLAESAEHLVKATKGYADPMGSEDAMGRMEADVLTRYDLYAMSEMAKWGSYTLNKMFKRPTSEIEKSNKDANISMDEKAIVNDVDFLVQHGVAGNDNVKRDFLGHTQAERIKKKAKAMWKDVFLRNLRIFLALFGEAFAVEFTKMVFPDFAKAK